MGERGLAGVPAALGVRGTTPLARRLAGQSGLYAVGSGVFLTGNAVFFTRIVGLSAGRVGLGISLAGVAAFLASVPIGRLTDRMGAQRTWVLSAAGEAVVYLAYPWVRGFLAFLVVLVLLALLTSAGNSARGAYTLAAVPRGERVRTLALVRSALNTGFTVGALLSGLALAVGSREVILAVPVLTALVLGLDALLVARLPRAVDEQEDVTPPVEAAARTGIRNRPFLVLSMLNAMLGLNQVLLTVVFPLWLVERTDAPHALLAWLYGTNTLLAVLLQVAAARGSETIRGSLRTARWAAASLTVACVVAMTTHWTAGLATVVLLWVAYVAVTGAELFSSAVSWGLSSELTDPSRRAEYQGVWRLGTQLQIMVGPAVGTWLAVTWRPEGFLVIALVAVLAALAMPRTAYAAARRVGASRAA